MCLYHSITRVALTDLMFSYLYWHRGWSIEGADLTYMPSTPLLESDVLLDQVADSSSSNRDSDVDRLGIGLGVGVGVGGGLSLIGAVLAAVLITKARRRRFVLPVPLSFFSSAQC